MYYLVIRRLSRKLGDPRRLGIDGDRDERLPKRSISIKLKCSKFLNLIKKMEENY